MELEGTVQNGVVVVDSESPLPEGTKVKIVIEPDAPAAETLTQRLARKAQELDLHGLPTDLAQNHDHYLHGLPKGIDEK